MYLSIFDLILFGALLVFAAFGFFSGLIAAVGGLIGLVGGVWVAGKYSGLLSEFIQNFIDNQQIADIVAFVVIFALISRLVGLIFYWLQKAFHFIPFTKIINRILGGVFGLVEGLLAMGLVIFYIKQSLNFGWFNEAITNSVLAPWLVFIGKLLAPLIPKLIEHLSYVV